MPCSVMPSPYEWESSITHLNLTTSTPVLLCGGLEAFGVVGGAGGFIAVQVFNGGPAAYSHQPFSLSYKTS